MSGTAAWVYLNGALVPREEAKVPAGDAGLLYGRGLFETFRARAGKAYRLERHFQRLLAGAAVLGVPVPLTLEGLHTAVRELCGRCGLEDARVRLTVTAGPDGGRPTVLVQARPAAGYPPSLYERGMRATMASVRRNETSPLSRVKSLNCLDNVLAREEAQRAGCDEALLLNSRGFLAEGSARNVFAVRSAELVTPPVEDGALPGVTREAVLEIARAAGIAAREASVTLDDLLSADEAFLTSAMVGVIPLVSVNGAAVASGRPGETTLRLRRMYEEAAAG